MSNDLGLILSRRPGEAIIIGGNVRVTLLSLEPGRAQISVCAPPEVSIDREEIHDRKLAEARA
jgi:carbon storage regulator